MGSQLASLPLAAPPSILLPPLLLSTCLYITYIHTCITEWSQFLEQVGEGGLWNGAWEGQQKADASGPDILGTQTCTERSGGVLFLRSYRAQSFLHRVRPERQTGTSITLLQGPGSDKSAPGQRGGLLPGGSENFWAETTVELGLEGRGMKEKPCFSHREKSVRNSVRAAWGEPEWLVGAVLGVCLALWVSELGADQPGCE